MKLFFRTLAIIMAALFAVYMVGCGDGDDEPEPEAAAFVSATPASGGDLAANGSISVSFDNNPGDVTVSAGTVAGSGKSRNITGPFTPGALALNITWTNGDGSHTLNYTVVAADEAAPEVTGSNPKDGAEGVDPAKVFEDGIEVTFNEPVTGDLMLMDGDDDVGWTSKADGNKIMLSGNAGQELSNETEYEIAGTVKDGAGNEAEISLTFVTKAKE
ncbi:MAG: Ig-like domain-containing protein [Candidatus Poribacteria bacterium]|nr:Ig-like domain-containing protein [Candidatus Poribacteria bacterium]